MLEAEVVMQMAGEVLLDAEEPRLPSAWRVVPFVAGRFRRFGEVALRAVLLEGHWALCRLAHPVQWLGEDQHQDTRCDREGRGVTEQVRKRQRLVEAGYASADVVAHRGPE